MKVFIFVVLTLACAVYAAEDEFCYSNVVGTCNTLEKGGNEGPLTCNAKYGAIDHVLSDLQKFTSTHITRSYQYLLMSIHYANYVKNRAGFEKLFRDLSDSKWNTAIELIKYVSKRGGHMDFNKHEDFGLEKKNYELYELESLAYALDIEKKLAKKSNAIHHEVVGRNKEHHDPEMSSYIEEEFSEKQSGLIRKLAGFTTDLHSMLSGPDSSLSLYLFDEYLQKQ